MYGSSSGQLEFCPVDVLDAPVEPTDDALVLVTVLVVEPLPPEPLMTVTSDPQAAPVRATVDTVATKESRSLEAMDDR